MWIIVLKALLALLLIPLLLTLAISRAEKSPHGMPWIRRWLWNFWTALLALSVTGAVVTEVLTNSDGRVDDEVLDFFDRSVFEDEIDALKPATPPIDWDTKRQELVRKFELVSYAHSKNDSNKAVEVLREIKDGKDRRGTLLKISSFTVANNLGCAYFHLQRNSDFRSSSHLLEAQRLVGNTQPFRRRIDANLERLNRMVNGLD